MDQNDIPANNSDIQHNSKASKAYAYLTKRIIASAARKSFYEGARETIAVMGYNVIARDGWVVKVDASGNILERISRIAHYKKQAQTRLD